MSTQQLHSYGPVNEKIIFSELFSFSEISSLKTISND